MLEFSSTESCTTSNTSTPLVGFSSNDSSCDGNVALMNDFESTGGCSGQGPQGPQGFSAYQIAVFDGFVGTEEEWLASLVGPGVPIGGTAGQILAKIDLTNYNTQWINLPSLTGYVPYIGATQALNLGAFSLTANSIIKNGGTSSQYLMADGTTSLGFVLPSLTSGSVLFSDGTTIAQNNANFFWNNANNRLGIGTTTPSYALHVNGVTGSTTFTIPSYNSQLNQNYLMLYGGYGAGMQGTYNNPTGGDLTFGTFINSIFNEKMRLLPSGNLGIGTSTPNHKLELSSAGYTSLGIFSGANNSAEISFQNTGYALPRWTIRSTGVANGSSGSLTFQRLANTFPFTITNNDNVLIGTTVDNGGKLQIKAGGSAGTDIALRIRNSGDTTDLFAVFGNNTTVIGNSYGATKFSSGNFGYLSVGITGEPIVSLVSNVQSSTQTLNGVTIPITSGNLVFSSAYGYDVGNDYNIISVGKFGIKVGNTTSAVQILSNGNVGIGTTAPAYKLDVSYNTLASGNGTANITAQVKNGSLYFDNISASAVPSLIFNAYGTNFVQFWGSQSAQPSKLYIGGSPSLTVVPTTPLMTWDVDNNRVGIGTTTPTSIFQVKTTTANTNGSICFTNNSASTIASITDTGSALTMLQFRASSYNFTDCSGLRIASTGYANTPSAMLNVIGAGFTSATTSVLVQNSSLTSLLAIRDDGMFNIYAGAFSSGVGVRFNTSGTYSSSGLNLHSDCIRFNQFGILYFTQTTAVGSAGYTLTNSTTFSPTAGTANDLNIGSVFSAGAGAALYRPLTVTYTLNNTGAQTGTATGIFLNATETALNGMGHNLMDLQVDGVSKFLVSRTGLTTISTGAVIGGSTVVGYAGTMIYYSTQGSGTLKYSASGVWAFQDVFRLQLGGTTNLFPSIKRNGSAIDFRLADDSAYCNITAGTINSRGTHNFEGTDIYPSANNSFMRLNGGSSGNAGIIAVYGSSHATLSGETDILLGTTVTAKFNSVASPSSVLELVSTTKGFLPPRMTTAQKTGIVSPATGLVVFDTDLGKLCVFAVTWQTITSV